MDTVSLIERYSAATFALYTLLILVFPRRPLFGIGVRRRLAHARTLVLHLSTHKSFTLADAVKLVGCIEAFTKAMEASRAAMPSYATYDTEWVQCQSESLGFHDVKHWPTESPAGSNMPISLLSPHLKII